MSSKPISLPVFDLAACMDLASSPEALRLRQRRSEHTETSLAAAATAYVESARARGIAPDYWFVPCHEQSLANMAQSSSSLGKHSRSTHRIAGPMFCFMKGSRAAKALGIFSDAGCSPWTAEYHHSLTVTTTLHANEMAHLIFHGDLAQASRSKVLPAALKLVPSSRAPDFFTAILRTYASDTAKSSKTSKGVLGGADKAARNIAVLLDSCSEDFLGLARRLDQQNNDPLGSCLLQASDLLKDARERLVAKLDKAVDNSGAAFNPEQLKKSLAPHQKSRMLAVNMLCREFPHDDELITACFETIDWLVHKPLVASLQLGYENSLMGSALRSGSTGALAFLERINANVWLASAQADEANACLWVSRIRGRPPLGSPDPNLIRVARMLLLGAWLDGHDEPKLHCCKLADLAQTSSLSDPDSAALRELRAEMERQTLADFIDTPNADSDRQGGSAREPRRACSL